jgi:hypothetical protein
MLFQASRAVPASSEMSRLIRVSEYAPPSPSLLIPACIETLGANSGANQLPKGSGRRAAFRGGLTFGGSNTFANRFRSTRKK